MTGMTLEDAVAVGQGVERPCRCPVHDDSQASASVNVLKGVWYCHACFASGTIDGKKTPSVDSLKAMMEPEKIPREYSDAFLELYTGDPDWMGQIYWAERFAPATIWFAGMGQDPFTGDATFPVHTPRARLAGVGRRRLDPGDGPRYLYPKVWSASQSLFGVRAWSGKHRVVVLVEGAADAAACWEVGVPAFGCYGAGLHLPQIELLARYAPDLVLAGFDNDQAGERATDRAHQALDGRYEVRDVFWSGSDPADTHQALRLQDLIGTVQGSGYGDEVVRSWTANKDRIAAAYRTHVEEIA